MKYLLALLFTFLQLTSIAHTGRSLFSLDEKLDILDRYIIARINEQVDLNDHLVAERRYSEVNYLIDARNTLMRRAVPLASDFKSTTNLYLNQQQGTFTTGSSYACYVLLTSESSGYSDRDIAQMLEYLNSKGELSKINFQTVKEISAQYYRMGGGDVMITPPPPSSGMTTDDPVVMNPSKRHDDQVNKEDSLKTKEILSRSRLGDDNHLGVLLHYHNSFMLLLSNVAFYTHLNLAFDTRIEETTRIRIEAALQMYDFDSKFQQDKSANKSYGEYLQGMIENNVHQLLESTLDNYLASSEAIYATEASHILQYIINNYCTYSAEIKRRLTEGHYNNMRASDRVLLLNMLSQNFMGDEEEFFAIRVLQTVFAAPDKESQIPIVLAGLKAPAQRRICKAESGTSQVKVITRDFSLLATLHSGIDNLSPIDPNTWSGDGGNFASFVAAIYNLVKSSSTLPAELSSMRNANNFEMRYVNWDQTRQLSESYAYEGTEMPAIKNVGFSSGKITYDYYPLIINTEYSNAGCEGTFISLDGQVGCYKYKYRHSRNASQVSLDPLDLVMFTSMTSSEMMNGVGGGSGKMIIVPAYFLYAMRTTEFTQAALQNASLALDIISLASCAGAYRAAVSQLAKYVVLLDVASSASGIINSTALSSGLPPFVQQLFQDFETLTGLAGMGHGAVGVGFSTLQLGRYVKARINSTDLNGIKVGVEQCCLKINAALTDATIQLSAEARQQSTMMMQVLEKKLKYYYNFVVNYVSALFNTTGSIAKNLTGATKISYQKLINSGLYSVELDNTIKLFNSDNKLIAEITNNKLVFKYSGFGGDIVMVEGKSTAVFGRFNDLIDGGGTKEFIQSPSKVYETGVNPNGLNILNITDWTWTKNEAWVIESANRGDIIRFISDPKNPKNIFKDGISGQRTVTGLEVETLENLGYEWDVSKFQFIKP